MVSGPGTAYSLEWSVAQALPIPWNGQWLKANEVQRGGGDCALAHWITQERGLASQPPYTPMHPGGGQGGGGRISRAGPAQPRTRMY